MLTFYDRRLSLRLGGGGAAGDGGVGKTMLAAAFARATATLRALPDGIVWVSVGQQGDALQVTRQVGLAFGDDAGRYTNSCSAQAALANLLGDKVCLVVLDDAWESAAVTPIRRALGARCGLLVTTRNAQVIRNLGAWELTLGALDEEEALELLAAWSDQAVDALPAEARAVAKECGNLPLALAMVGAMVRGKPDRWGKALHRLRTADLEKIKIQFPNYPYPDVLRAVEVSVNTLEPGARARYLDFAIFPDEPPVPESALIAFLGAGRAGRTRQSEHC